MPNNSGQFSCADSPLNVNPFTLYNEAEPYYSYFGKFNSPEVGPMILKTPTNGSGLIIEENNQNSFTRNGVVYSLIDCRLYGPGLHNILKSTGTFELCMFFQNINSSTQTICICVPIYIDDLRGALYFSQLRQSFDSTISNRQTLGSIFNFATSDAIEYVSYDIRNRRSSSSYPVYYCNVDKFLVTYTVLKTPIFMKYNDYNYLTSTSTFKAALNPPKALNEITNNSIFKQKFVRLCKNIQFTFKDGKSKKQAALKCYSVDPTKDVGEDGLIDLSKADDTQKSIDETVKSLTTDITAKVETGLSMSSVEMIIGIIVAVITSLIILGLIGYGLFKYFSSSSNLTVIEELAKKGITIAVRR